MSETDDTDVLLLIPPDFFLVRSSSSEDSLLDSSRTVVHKPQSCTSQVIGKLVDQVHLLESRLESLEINTSIADSSLASVARRKNWETDSLDSKSFDSKYYTFPRRRRKSVRKQRNRERSLTSLDSLGSQRNIPRLKLQEHELLSLKSKETDTLNDSKSMDGDLSSIVSTPSKKNDKLLLNEIDEFLTKVESYETPESKYQECSVSPGNVIKATGDYISSKLGSKDDDTRIPLKTVSTSVLDKYIYLLKGNPQSETRSENDLHTVTETTLKNPHNDPSINQPSTSTMDSPKQESSKDITDTKSPSIRRLNFTNKDVQPTSTPKKQTTYVDSFKPSSNKIYDRASKVLEQYKAQNCSRNGQNSSTDSYMLREEFKMPQMKPFVGSKESLKNKFIESIDTDLLSLSELWGEKESKDRGDSSKLEEERVKREHCEAMIQQLQKKLLDQQEKLAVAIKVDRAKDTAIAKLKDSWLRLTGSLDKAEERHRQGMDRMLRETENFKQVANEAQKKTEHFEAELYKALDLAHDYQEKCKQLASKTKELQENMDKTLADKDEAIARKEKELEVLKDNLETVMRLNKQSTDCVKNLEDALEKEKLEHNVTKNKVTELLSNIQSAEDDTTLLQQERELLKQKLSEERTRADLLHAQLGNKQDYTSELLKKCDNLEAEVGTLRKHLDLQKNELKSHYQKQLEDAVLAKLTEFQHQLDLAEKEMENEARGKEMHIVDTFNKQIARIEEQHKLEINILEEKQKEEIKLYRLQLAQSSEKIGLLENKLDTYRRRRGQIASQLHSVMEAQWRQALLILTNNPSSSLDLTRAESVSTPVAQDYAPPKIPPLTLPAFDKRLLRPDHSDMFNFEGLSDNELQQYVKLLLTKPPGGDGDASSADKGAVRGDERGARGEEPTSDRAEARRRAKPPWKA